MKIERREKKNKAWKVYVGYTLLFLAVFFLSFLPFIQEKRSLLWNPDAVVYHIPMAEVFANVLKQIIHNFQEGKFLSFGFYDFSIGMGTDMFQYISQWYMEPLNVLYVFFDVKVAEYIYEVLIVCRLYLCGISFLLYSGVLKQKNMARIMGTMVYVFSGYTVFTATKAPPFLGSMILLPLVFLGVERIKEGKSRVFFCLVIALSAVFSFYFLFMNSLFLAMYVLLDIWEDKLSFKEAFGRIWRLIGYYLIGICMGGFSVLPFVGGFLNSSRSGGLRNAQSLFYYGGEYYQMLIEALFASRPEHNYWLVIGFSPAVLLSVIVMLVGKDKSLGKLKTAWIISLLGVCIPLFGVIMNAGKVANNRWLYGLMFVAGVTVCVTWDKLLSVGSRCFSMIKPEKRRMAAGIVLSLFFVGTMVASGYHLFSKTGEGFASEFHKQGKGYSTLTKNSNMTIKKIKDNSLYRVDSTKTPKTASSAWIKGGYHGLVTNASGYSKEMMDYYRFFESAAVISGFRLTGMDNSTIQTTLAGVKYYTSPEGEEDKLPYGYRKIKKGIYQNENPLSFGYVYDSYISDNELANKTPTEKQEAMLQSVILDEESFWMAEEQGLVKRELQYDSRELPYEIRNFDGIEIDSAFENICVSKENGGFDLVIEDIPGPGEIYVEWKGISILSEEVKNISIKMEEDGKTKSSIAYQNPTNTYSSGQDTYAANIGYSTESERRIRVSFNKIADYMVEDMEVYYLPLTQYEEMVQERSREDWQITEWSDTEISGVAETTKAGFLCFPIVYSDGWSVYVNGEQQTLHKANLMYCGVFLDAGKSEVCLVYESPFLKAGAFLSVVGFLSLLGICFCENRRRKEQKEWTNH